MTAQVWQWHSTDILCHYQRPGAHWHVRNGPPYPLGREQVDAGYDGKQAKLYPSNKLAKENYRSAKATYKAAKQAYKASKAKVKEAVYERSTSKAEYKDSKQAKKDSKEAKDEYLANKSAFKKAKLSVKADRAMAKASKLTLIEAKKDLKTAKAELKAQKALEKMQKKEFKNLKKQSANSADEELNRIVERSRKMPNGTPDETVKRQEREARDQVNRIDNAMKNATTEKQRARLQADRDIYTIEQRTGTVSPEYAREYKKRRNELLENMYIEGYATKEEVAAIKKHSEPNFTVKVKDKQQNSSPRYGKLTEAQTKEYNLAKNKDLFQLDFLEISNQEWSPQKTLSEYKKYLANPDYYMEHR